MTKLLVKKKNAPGRVGAGVARMRPTNPVPSTSPSIKQLVCSIDDPFCTESFGAKVPDEYSLPTEPLTLRHRFSYTPSAVGNYLVVTPHPTLGTLAVGTDGSVNSPTAISGSTAQLFAVSNVAGRVNQIAQVGPIAPLGLSGISSSYRVVGWGVRLKNITAASNVAGETLVAVLPTSGSAPNVLAPLANGQNRASDPRGQVFSADTGPQWDELARWAGLPTNNYSALNGTAGTPVLDGIDNVPSSEIFSNAELAQTGGVLIKPKLHSPPAAWRFRPSGTQIGNASQSCGAAIVPINATTQGAVGGGYNNYNQDFLDTSGHNCVIIVPNTIATVQTYEIEVIYHLESIPVLSSANGAVGAGYTASPVAAPGQVENALYKLWRAPWVEFVKHEGSRAIGSMVQALPGLMTRAAMMAMA